MCIRDRYLPDPRTKLDATAPPLKSSTSFPYDFGAMLRWRTELFQPNPRYFDTDATAAMSFVMPLPLMARVAQSDRLPPNMQRDVALAVWTRAVLLDDAEIANSVTPTVARHFPQYGAGWKAYQSAATPQQKKIEAALLLLRLPGASPWFAAGLGYPYMRDVIGLVATRWWERGDADNQAVPDAPDDVTLCDDCALPLQFCPAGLPHVAGSRSRAQRGRTLAPASRSARLSRRHHYRLGQCPAARSAGARGASPGGAGNAIRANEYRDVEGSLSAAAQSLSPQSLDVENTPLVYSTRR